MCNGDLMCKACHHCKRMLDGNYCCTSIHDTKEKTSDATGDALYGTVICIRAGQGRIGPRQSGNR